MANERWKKNGEIAFLRQQVEELTKDRDKVLDVLENLLIGIGMGWDLDGLVDQALDVTQEYLKQRQAKIMEEMIAEDAHLLEDDNGR